MLNSGLQEGSAQQLSQATQEGVSPDDNIRAGLNLASQALVDTLLAERPSDEVAILLERAMLSVHRQDAVFGIIPCEIARRRLMVLMRAVEVR